MWFLVGLYGNFEDICPLDKGELMARRLALKLEEQVAVLLPVPLKSECKEEARSNSQKLAKAIFVHV